MVKVPVNVRMIELDTGENGDPGGIVDEFGALVEEGRIIFIPFDDKVGTPAGPEVSIEISANSFTILLAFSVAPSS